jgi:hypothetical protein
LHGVTGAGHERGVFELLGKARKYDIKYLNTLLINRTEHI